MKSSCDDRPLKSNNVSQPVLNGFRPPHQGALSYLVLAILCAALVASAFALQGNAGFNLWDEGFLWYGAQRVIAGEIPVRDFMAYDPGRYYWSAALMRLYGDNGIMALRGAVAIFQALGLFVGMVLLARSTSKRDIGLWLLAAITFMAWMFPRHKLFDISVSIALIGALSFLVQQPTSRRYFLTGLVVGLAAVFGRNHGLYGAIASLGVMTYLGLRRESSISSFEAFAIWAAGVIIGYIPILFLLAAAPGFAQAFWESILYLFEFKNTNIPLPIPWPWRIQVGELPTLEMVRRTLIGLFFVAIIVFGLLGIAWVVRQRLQRKTVPAVLVACAFLALPYAHHGYSRADVGHLAQAIFPFLLGSLVLLANQSAKVKWSFAALLCGSSLMVMLPLHPGWKCYSGKQCVETDVAGSTLKVEPATAKDLALLHKLAEEFAPNDRSFVATPYWPGAYAALERKSPVWEIYALTPRSTAFQNAEIERIKAAAPGFVMIFDFPLDGKNDMRFSITHPDFERYIREHFERVNGYTQNPAYQLYISRQLEQEKVAREETNNHPSKQF